jgi:NADH-quinone oxidoreductase subunit E
MLGAGRLRDAVAAAAGAPEGGTSADQRFTLLPMVCLGACDHAPVLMIDDDLHGDADPADAAALLARYA